MTDRSRPACGAVALLSLEPWDVVQRRNQHLATRLVKADLIDRLTFVEPVVGGLQLRARRRSVSDRIDVVTPPLITPRRYGGHRPLGRWLGRQLAGHDLLWINDPVAGTAALRHDTRAVYDVTDDWRSMPQDARDRARIVAAEDSLAVRARTVVCSAELAARWQQRYDLHPAVVRNGVDVAAIRSAVPRTLDGPGPHALYVGTLHPNRIDVDLLRSFARAWVGTVHLVGPNSFDPDVLADLQTNGVRTYGAVAADEVPSWLAAADVLVCPHLVDDFTLSLDAIKSHEYLATDAPVVATPSSGFQSINAPGLTVQSADGFAHAALAAVGSGPWLRDVAVDWDERAQEFGVELLAALRGDA